MRNGGVGPSGLQALSQHPCQFHRSALAQGFAVIRLSEPSRGLGSDGYENGAADATWGSALHACGAKRFSRFADGRAGEARAVACGHRLVALA